MNPITRVSLVVPYYDEVNGIPPLAAKLRSLASHLRPGYQLECVLVDDGTCPAGQIKEMRGTKMTQTGVTRTSACVPRFGPKTR